MTGSKEEEILSAIDSGSYKFAITQAQKLIKRSPNVTYYQVLYNFALLESGKEEKATNNCLELMSKTPNDPKSLHLLNTILNKVGKKTEALQVYENAAKKYASFEILTNWFHLGCETADVRVLQKSAMALKNYNSKQRLFNLWAGFTSYLAAVADDATTIEKTLFPKLGLKLVESLKPLKSEQEVYVLVKLLEINGQDKQLTEEILEFTGDNKLDLELQVILLETLDKLQDWERLYKYSELILIDYKLDDFNTWKYFIKSGLNLNKDEEVLQKINDYQTRNSRLALVEYHYQINTDIHESVFEFLRALGSKTSAFFDIKQYSSKIDGEKLLLWLSEQPVPDDKNGMIWTLNTMKFKTYFNKNRIFQSSEFITENMNYFDKFRSLLSTKSEYDLFPGDEFLLLAIQSLLSQEFSIRNIITSIIILENALLKDKHEFHLRLWLIQLYTLINCHNQAKVHYDVLKIKNVQHDIFDHYLVSRLSSIYPQNDYLKQGLELYNTGDHIYFLKIGFNKGAFSKLGSMIEFIHRLDNSALKKHRTLQGAKLARLFSDRSIGSFYDGFLTQEKTYDNRDFGIFWDFGIAEELSFKNQILANIPLSSTYDEAQQYLEGLIEGQELNEQKLDLSELTKAEKWSFDLITNIAQLLTGDETRYSLIENSFKATPVIPDELTWEVTHTIITIIDTCKAINTLITHFNSNQKADKKQIDTIKALANSLLQKIRDDTVLEMKFKISNHIQSLKDQLSNSEILIKAGIKSQQREKIFDIIAYANNETFKLLRIL